ncbi:MAG: beta-ketoacyl synthase N-terminal-like domain-containing protein [Verrucomicrobiota bacterium]
MSELTDSKRILDTLRAAREQIEKLKKPKDQRIAIIGMSGRFPGAENLDEFWELLREGKSGIREVSETELKEAGVPESEYADSNYVKQYASFDDPTSFDAGFFGYSPGEAAMLEPQHRVFLECAWTALEDAGYDSHQYEGRIGVYGGTALNSYILNLNNDSSTSKSVNEVQAVVSNVMGLMPTRVSYHMDLKGPSCGIQTGCSTSLVALHEACRSLVDGDCELALAGGVTIGRAEPEGYLHEPGGIASPDGCCRAFDREGKGTLFGNGVGVLILKRLEDAVKDGDTIRAVILGTAINNDGADKVGLLAPSVNGQAEVIKSAFKRANVSPSTVSYVEGHGTATELGDPVEFSALTQAMAASLQAENKKCRIGSVKSNVGHLDAAAGVAGVIKTVLALQHETIPATLHFNEPNPQIDLVNSPFSASCENHAWTRSEEPRRAGVSSFGMGGTNAHAILEEAPLLGNHQESIEDDTYIFPLSAKTSTGLKTQVQQLGEYLQANETSLKNIAYTLQVGRRSMEHRCVVVAKKRNELLNQLQKAKPNLVEQKAPVVFLFSGQGSQYVGMAKELYEQNEVFRASMEACAFFLLPELDLFSLLFENESSLQDTAHVQPVLFAVEYSMAQLVKSWGIEPDAMLGHSLGEYVAACLAGVFSLEDALKIVCKRGQLMQSCPKGKMLAVRMRVEAAKEILTERLEVAAVNSPEQIVISGTEEDILTLKNELERKGIVSQVLDTSHAFHSHLMDPVLQEYRSFLNTIIFHTPNRDIISNRTGVWLTSDEATSPQYWVEHLRNTVLFANGLKKLQETLPDAVYLELGPGNTLCRLANMTLGNNCTTISTLTGIYESDYGIPTYKKAKAMLWLKGVPIQWANTYDEEVRRVPLPTYPFERAKHYIPRKSQPDIPEVDHSKKQPIENWFFAPSWKQQPFVVSTQRQGTQEKDKYIIFGDVNLKTEWQKALSSFDYVWVEAGGEWQKTESSFVIRANEEEDYTKLVATLDFSPTQWVHAWTFGEEDLVDSFDSLVALGQALAKANFGSQQYLNVVTSNLFEITGSEKVNQERAALPGLVKVMPQEISHLNCRLIEGRLKDTHFPNYLAEELASQSSDQVIAYRNGNRWIRSYESLELPETKPELLKEEGYYLVIGDLVDGLGMVYAQALRDYLNAKILVLGREGIPEPSEWDAWFATHGAQHPLSKTAQKIKALGREGVDFVMASVDLKNSDQVRVTSQALMERMNVEDLSGIFYADVMGGEASCAFIDLDHEDKEKIFEKKIRYLDSVSNLVEVLNPEFVVMQSSLSSIVGGAGFSAYAAASSYLDGFIERQKRSNFFSMNWDACRIDEDDMHLDSDLMALAFDSEEVWEATRRMVGQPQLSRIVVSPRSLDDRLNYDPRKVCDETNENSAERLLDNEYEAPETDIEKAVAKAMGDLLGIAKIGRHDDFFSMGGHSLLAIQAITKLRKDFKVDVPMRAILQGTPTVAGISKVIEENMGDLSENQVLAVEDLLDQIENEENQELAAK